MRRGYFGIGIYHTKMEVNIGTLWRSAQQLGAAFIFTIGRRYKKQASDTSKAYLHLPLYHYLDWDEFKSHMPKNCLTVAVEMGGTALSSFAHPERAIYILGAEDNGLPDVIVDDCNMLVSLEAINIPSYNVAVAGSIVMYSRLFG